MVHNFVNEKVSENKNTRTENFSGGSITGGMTIGKSRYTLRRELDKMLVPYPADLIRGVILVFGKPKLSFFADNVKYLDY